MDLQLGRGISIIASYVAITRVETKERLLIYRPFDREPFMRGAPEGPTLLLRKLRGEQIDWKQIESMHTPQGICNSCKKMKYKDEFRLGQWKKLNVCAASAKTRRKRKLTCRVRNAKECCRTRVSLLQPILLGVIGSVRCAPRENTKSSFARYATL